MVNRLFKSIDTGPLDASVSPSLVNISVSTLAETKVTVTGWMEDDGIVVVGALLLTTMENCGPTEIRMAAIFGIINDIESIDE